MAICISKLEIWWRCSFPRSRCRKEQMSTWNYTSVFPSEDNLKDGKGHVYTFCPWPKLWNSYASEFCMNYCILYLSYFECEITFFCICFLFNYDLILSSYQTGSVVLSKTNQSWRSLFMQTYCENVLVHSSRGLLCKRLMVLCIGYSFMLYKCMKSNCYILELTVQDQVMVTCWCLF